MMHDFICGECFSSSSSPTANPLTTNDIHVSPTHLYVGSTSVLISGRAVLASSVRLSCKALPSVLDCVYGLSAIHIGCCPPSPSSSSSSLISSAALIDVNTCKIHCSRCQSYLGDGTISSSDKAEGKEDVQSQAFTEKTMQPPSFDLDDIATVRLPLHAIAIRSSSNESLSFILSLSTEQVNLVSSSLPLYLQYLVTFFLN